CGEEIWLSGLKYENTKISADQTTHPFIPSTDTFEILWLIYNNTTKVEIICSYIIPSNTP
ncbi:hypothetical protein ACEV75_24585, partial [Vibrio parahaemolyticus]